MRAHAEQAAYVHVIVNERREAGASLPHTHAQLYALDFVPAAVARERERFGAYAVRTMGGNLLDDLVQEEVRRRERIVAIDDEAVLHRALRLAPALPAHARAAAAARALRGRRPDRRGAAARRARAACARRLGASPPLNLWVRTAPRGAEHFCWRIDIVPRLTHLAGLELGTGVHLNIVAPEQRRRASCATPDARARPARRRAPPCASTASDVGAIGPGLLVLLGVTHDDTEADADRLADKVRALRVFPDAEGRMNEPLGDREVLVRQPVHALRRRPQGQPAELRRRRARPSVAEPLYERVCERLGAQRGVFGAHMEVELVNDGPVTLLLERRGGRWAQARRRRRARPPAPARRPRGGRGGRAPPTARGSAASPAAPPQDADHVRRRARAVDRAQDPPRAPRVHVLALREGAGVGERDAVAGQHDGTSCRGRAHRREVLDERAAPVVEATSTGSRSSIGTWAIGFEDTSEQVVAADEEALLVEEDRVRRAVARPLEHGERPPAGDEPLARATTVSTVTPSV